MDTCRPPASMQRLRCQPATSTPNGFRTRSERTTGRPWNSVIRYSRNIDLARSSSRRLPPSVLLCTKCLESNMLFYLVPDIESSSQLITNKTQPTSLLTKALFEVRSPTGHAHEPASFPGWRRTRSDGPPEDEASTAVKQAITARFKPRAC